MDWAEFASWLKGKMTFTSFILAISAGLYIAAKILAGMSSGSGSGSYAYAGLPEACICHECGYTVKNPGKHCKELTCPKCGARMWRLK